MRKRPLFHKQYTKRGSAIVASVVGIGVIGSVLVFSSHAATTTASVEVESGTASSNASTLTDTTASGGKAVKFAAAVSNPTMTNCINSPHLCGYPDATNTGVPAGTTLTKVPSQATSGTNWTWNASNLAVYITAPNVTISGLDVTGAIQLKPGANNVTIKNSRVTSCIAYPIENQGVTGLTVQDTEIAPGCVQAEACISFDNYTAIRVNCYGGGDGFKANANVTIEDSYIHDLAFILNPDGSSESHDDGVQSTGGSNVTLKHNTCDIRGGGDDCIQWGPTDTNWTVTNNLFAGNHQTSYILNGGPGTTNNSFTNNRFTRLFLKAPASLPGGNTWSGNYYDDDLSTANE